jgi:prepilin-type N-terminal cleavage/methylation domain-containing protein
MRIIAPHPFLNWYPAARWEFRPAKKNGAVTAATLPFASPHWGVNATGVADIVSRGAEWLWTGATLMPGKVKNGFTLFEMLIVVVIIVS